MSANVHRSPLNCAFMAGRFAEVRRSALKSVVVGVTVGVEPLPWPDCSLWRAWTATEVPGRCVFRHCTVMSWDGHFRAAITAAPHAEQVGRWYASSKVDSAGARMRLTVGLRLSAVM